MIASSERRCGLAKDVPAWPGLGRVRVRRRAWPAARRCRRCRAASCGPTGSRLRDQQGRRALPLLRAAELDAGGRDLEEEEAGEHGAEDRAGHEDPVPAADDAEVLGDVHGGDGRSFGGGPECRPGPSARVVLTALRVRSAPRGWTMVGVNDMPMTPLRDRRARPGLLGAQPRPRLERAGRDRAGLAVRPRRRGLERLGAPVPGGAHDDDFDEVLADDTVEAVSIATSAPTHAALAVRALRGRQARLRREAAGADQRRRARDGRRRRARRRRCWSSATCSSTTRAWPSSRSCATPASSARTHYLYTNRAEPRAGPQRRERAVVAGRARHRGAAAPRRRAARGGLRRRASASSTRASRTSSSGCCASRAGVIAHMHLSWLDPHKMRKITIVGSDKMAVFDDMDPDEKVKVFNKGVDHGPSRPPTASTSQLRHGDTYAPRLSSEEPLRIQGRHFARCVRGLEVPRSGRRRRPGRRRGARGAAAVAGPRRRRRGLPAAAPGGLQPSERAVSAQLPPGAARQSQTGGATGSPWSSKAPSARSARSSAARSAAPARRRGDDELAARRAWRAPSTRWSKGRGAGRREQQRQRDLAPGSEVGALHAVEGDQRAGRRASRARSTSGSQSPHSTTRSASAALPVRGRPASRRLAVELEPVVVLSGDDEGPAPGRRARRRPAAPRPPCRGPEPQHRPAVARGVVAARLVVARDARPRRDGGRAAARPAGAVASTASATSAEGKGPSSATARSSGRRGLRRGARDRARRGRRARRRPRRAPGRRRPRGAGQDGVDDHGAILAARRRAATWALGQGQQRPDREAVRVGGAQQVARRGQDEVAARSSGRSSSWSCRSTTPPPSRTTAAATASGSGRAGWVSPESRVHHATGAPRRRSAARTARVSLPVRRAGRSRAAGPRARAPRTRRRRRGGSPRAASARRCGGRASGVPTSWPAGGHGVEDLRRDEGAPAEREERRVRVVLGQQREQARGERRPGAVVVGQDERALLAAARAQRRDGPALGRVAATSAASAAAATPATAPAAAAAVSPAADGAAPAGTAGRRSRPRGQAVAQERRERLALLHGGDDRGVGAARRPADRLGRVAPDHRQRGGVGPGAVQRAQDEVARAVAHVPATRARTGPAHAGGGARGRPRPGDGGRRGRRTGACGTRAGRP